MPIHADLNFVLILTHVVERVVILTDVVERVVKFGTSRSTVVVLLNRSQIFEHVEK